MKKQKKQLMKYGVTVIIFSAFFMVAGLIKASVSESGRGWGWGGSNDGVGNMTGVGWTSMNNLSGGGAISYGIGVPLIDGSLTDKAWNQNLGYITFGDNNGGYLNGSQDGNVGARRVGNTLQGWARIVDIAKASALGNSGGYNGWIKLSGTASDGLPYGVTVDNATKTLAGKAWSDDLGWIDFSRVSFVPSNSLKICENACDTGPVITNGVTKSAIKNVTTTYKACYNTAPDCSDSFGDVTASANWSKTGTAVSILSNGNIKAIASGNSGVTVQYTPTALPQLTSTFNIFVDPSLCICNATTATNTCTSAPQFADSCGDIVCAGTKPCMDVKIDSWKEVTP